MKSLHYFALFLVLSLIFLFPIFPNFGNWGMYDWDQHMFYHGSARLAVMDYGQVPLWNAHYCGGTPLLANPQSAFISPFFLLVLTLGTVAGLKLSALAYLILGLFGTSLAARKLGASSLGSILASVVFMLSSWYALRIVVGHTTFFPFALLPWLFLFYLKSLEVRKWIAAAALTLAVMFLSGGIYPFYAGVMLLGIYSIFTAVEQRKLSPIFLVAGIFALAFMLTAVKILPVMELTSGVPVQNDVQLNSPSILGAGLFSPQQKIEANNAWTGRNSMPEGTEKELATLNGSIAWQWHEYSAYIGLAALLAALSLLQYRRYWKLIATALFFFILSLGNLTPLWALLRTLPFFSALHGPSRFGITFVLVIALLAGIMLSRFKVPHKKIAVPAILAVVIIEHLFVFVPLVSGAFPIEPPQDLNTGNENFIQFYSSYPEQAQYSGLLQNLGTLNCYERIHVATRASPQFVDGRQNPNFPGNAYIAETQQQLGYSYFSPNKVVVSLENANITDDATLVINQNYYPGWHASNGKEFSIQGVIATEITPQDREMAFIFHQNRFGIGILISLLGLLIAAAVFFKPKQLIKLLQEQS